MKTLLSVTALLLSACTQNPAVVEVERIFIPPVGEVELQHSISDPEAEELLNIGVLVFSNPIDDRDSLKFGEWVFSEIRDNETHYLPYVLRNTLIDSNQWGAIRVLPREDPSVDLLISGSVLASDGSTLELQIRAIDSTGRVWLDKAYADTTIEVDYPASTRFTAANRFDAISFIDPFQDIYDQVANDLLVTKAGLSRQEIVDIGRVSQMVYASDLAPESFAHNLQPGPDGRLTVTSLPASDDPMIARVEDMRLRHHLFIDTVDEYYAALYEEMQPAYVIWRRYSFDQELENKAARNRVYNIDDYGSSRNYLTLTQRYDRFRWSKIYELEFRELAAGFNLEIAPAILELNKEVHGLSGTMEEQYLQWRNILRSLFALEIADAIPAN